VVDGRLLRLAATFGPAVWLALAAAGCGAPPTPSGALDARPEATRDVDASAPEDGAAPDGGARADATAPSDVGPEPPSDAGAGSDASPGDPDADAAPSDAGSLDAGQLDAGSDPDAAVVDVGIVPVQRDLRDYGFTYWPTHFRPPSGGFASVRHVQTGFYGLAFDITRAAPVRLGLFVDARGERAALVEDAARVGGLPTATVTWSVSLGGAERIAVAFAGRDGDRGNPSELVDAGHWMQRLQVPSLGYAGTSTVRGEVELAALPRHLVLTHAAHRTDAPGPLGVHMELSGAAVDRYPRTVWLDPPRALEILDASDRGWTFVLPADPGARIERRPNGHLRFVRTATAVGVGEALALSVLAIPRLPATSAERAAWLEPAGAARVEYAQLRRDGSAAETATTAAWDPRRGAYRVALRDLTRVGGPRSPDWSDAQLHNWYNRHRIVVHNDGLRPLSVPIAFDASGRVALYVTGGSPLLRDPGGEPTGARIQISKNWHEQPSWYHLYTALVVPPGRHEYELTFAHARWGTRYAVAHAQLALIGWGVNQQWDESSLGAWGETITYDPDLTLRRAMVDDVRPFLVDTAGRWGWTGNVGGADFLVYETPAGERIRLARMRSLYAATGPNLTRVVYAGLSRDGRIEATLTTELGRTDDLVRAWYHLDYRFLRDVPYRRLALFQVAADRYSDNGFTRYAWGDARGVHTDAAVVPASVAGYASEADRGLVFGGPAPWVMLYASDRQDRLGERLADVGFVVRDYRAELGGVASSTPALSLVRTLDGPSQIAFELGLPEDPSRRVVPAGSRVRATVEYLVPPAAASAYYGTSDHLSALDPSHFGTPELMRHLAAGNRLAVRTDLGQLRRLQPVELEAATGTTAARFTLSGGLGDVPITIRGLPRPDGWRLERQDGGTWERVDQSVEGQDYWQAGQDPGSGRFELIFNVPNRGTETYRLVR
jgi:hypothetical protein